MQEEEIYIFEPEKGNINSMIKNKWYSKTNRKQAKKIISEFNVIIFRVLIKNNCNNRYENKLKIQDKWNITFILVKTWKQKLWT